MKRNSIWPSIALACTLCANTQATILINEIDSDTPGGDADEFVELKGTPGESADNMTLVFFQSDQNNPANPGTSTYAVSLTGLVCDANGYILLADPNVQGGGDLPQAPAFIKNYEGAVALYENTQPGDFPNGSVPTTTNLVDVVVYRAIGTNAGDWSGFGSPTPVAIAEGGNPNVPAAFSVARVPDLSGNWVAASPTPRAPNQIESISITNTFLRPRFNQVTATQATPFSVRLKNTGPEPIYVSKFDLGSTSSAAFSVTAPSFAPISVAYNETLSLELQLQDNNPSTNGVYTAVINYATDTPTSPSGSYLVTAELVRATNQSASAQDVVVNEISYAPANTDHNNDGDTVNQNDEFVELYNTTAAAINIEGWEQRSTDATGSNFHSFVFPAGTVIAPHGFVTVFTAGNPTGFLPGTTFTYGIPRLANGGAKAEVNDASKLIDGVAYLAAQDDPDVDGYTNAGVSLANGGSIGRRPDGTATFRTFNPTDSNPADRPTPNTSNNGGSSVSDWVLY